MFIAKASNSPKLPAKRLRQRILRHHSGLALITAASMSGFCFLLSSNDPITKWSMGTAYVSLVLLATTLITGPIYMLRGLPLSPSTGFRRDVGIWSALVGLAHVIFGLQVHLRGKMWQYFFYPAHPGEPLHLRHDLFGVANYTGLLAAIILFLLLLSSNDLILRLLKAKRWKNLQRLNYGLFVLVIIHSFAYHVETRPILLVCLFGLSVGTAVTCQLMGIWIVSRRNVT